MKKLSISIGCYNGEKYLKETLDSIMSSDYEEDVEILFINDGSTDRTKEIADEYDKKYGNFKLINKENGGQGSTYNIGITESTGEYIVFMDADDFLELDKLLMVINGSCKSDIIAFNHYWYKDGVKKQGHSRNIEENVQYSFAEGKKKVSLFIHDLIYRRAFLVENHIYADTDYRIYCDMTFQMRINAKAETIEYYNEDIYGYRLSDEQSMSVTGLSKWSKDRYKMAISQVNTYFQIRDDKNNDKEVIKEARENAAGGFADGYIGALFGENTHKRIKEFNEIIKQDKELWNSASLFAKLARINNPLLYPLCRWLIKIRIKTMQN